MAAREISNHELKLERIPAVDCDRQALIRFAHTFNGYTFLDGADPSERFDADHSALTLSELRCLLFLQIRSDRWSGGLSTDWKLIRELVGAIRVKVQAVDLD